MHLIVDNLQKIRELCKKYKVKTLYVFGSILTSHFNDQSDIDLLVNFNKDEIEDPFINFFDMIYEFQDLLGRKIDLVDETSISNKIFIQNLMATRQLIYG